MHCLWTLPERDADFPARWGDLKTAFSKSLPAGEPRSLVRVQKGERGIREARYWPALSSPPPFRRKAMPQHTFWAAVVIFAIALVVGAMVLLR
jgi:hypothetical protein